MRLNIVIIGLALRSSWGNGHATTYRALIRALRDHGHRVRFLERDVPWYAEHVDTEDDVTACVALYGDFEELVDLYTDEVANADLVIVGSYVPEGIEVGTWVQATAKGITAFYDIDTPVTLAAVDAGRCDYLTPRLIARYGLYLSFTGGPTLKRLNQDYAANAVPLYCAVDPSKYAPLGTGTEFDFGYMGTYSDDRQSTVRQLLLAVASEWPEGRFVVAGAQYPKTVLWPRNVRHLEHVGPDAHRRFYNAQRFTLNVTRADMIRAGWSPSVRLFEAAACGVPIVSDAWPGLDMLFEPDKEILIARDGSDVLRWLRDMPDAQRFAIGKAARRRVLAEHTAGHRAEALENYVAQVPRRSTFPRLTTELVS